MSDNPTPCILIADDSAANRLTLKLELADAGFDVDEAASGTEAMDRLKARSYSAVVTDIWMPGANGIEVIQAIRAIDSEVPVFAITGGGPGLSIASAAALAEVWGAEKVYVKPFDVRDLVGAIREVLD
jgi:CheY-like chemotaxis protein